MIYDGKYISDNISYSLMRNVDEIGPKGLFSQKMKQHAGLSYGSVLDDYLFKEKDEFYDQYKVTYNDPPPLLKELAKKLKKILSKEEIDKISDNIDLQKKIVTIMRKENMYKNIKKHETFVSKFNYKEFYDYCKELYEEKTLVHISEFIKVQEGKNSLYTNKKTKHIFNNNLKNIYQLEVKFKYKNENIRCFLDIVLVNEVNKTILGIDLKTGSPLPEEFMSSYFKYKYYLQSSIYYMALEKFNEEVYNGEYKILNFKFLYLSRFDMDNPLIFNVSKKWINAGIKGFTTTNGYKYKGINELIDIISWHKKNKVFNLSRQAYEQPEINLEDNFITVNGS